MTAYTVTGSASGANAFNGVLLTVKVLTGAAAVQAGATAASITANPPQLGITPAATGSLVYGAVGNEAGNVDTAFTANAASTFSANVSDATNFISEGTFRSTATTAGGTPETLGGTAPTQACFITLAEIEASGTLAEDPSSPAPVNNQAGTSATTAAFAPPAGSLLVAQLVTHSASGGGNTLAVSSTPALTWTQLVADTKPATGIWIARVPGAPPAAAPPAQAADHDDRMLVTRLLGRI